MAGSRDDPAILNISVSWDTVSKSMATHTVRSGGLHWLKSVSMSVVTWRSADVVECLLGFAVNSFDCPPQLDAVGLVIYALNEFSPLLRV